jgi:serine phosphatase RsbU (regulator of sigma subunit)
MTLQRSLLPSALPAVPGLTMSVRYLPASDHAEIGGDFYEALARGQDPRCYRRRAGTFPARSDRDG